MLRFEKFAFQRRAGATNSLVGGVLLNTQRIVPQFVKGARHATKRFPQLLQTREEPTRPQEDFGVDPVFSMSSLLYNRKQVRDRLSSDCVYGYERARESVCVRERDRYVKGRLSE
jgi:hypothetical protein